MPKVKVLIVEDEYLVYKDIKNALIKSNFIVTDRLQEVDLILKSIEKDEPDIILMDINLNQEIDGIDIIKEVYKIKYIPVIYITGIDEEEVLNKALETNPAGYIVKPFNRETLKSTILLALYKINKSADNIISLGNKYFFDIRSQYLFYKDDIVKLGKKERRFLAILIKANEAPVSFEEIENYVWEDEIISNDAIRSMVSRLKRKINTNLIETIYSYGFKLIKLYD